MRKLKYHGFAVMLIFVMLFSLGCGSKDLTKGKSPQEILKASATAMQDIKNYSMEFVINSNLGSTEVKPLMTAKAKYQLDPMAMQLDGKMSIMGQEFEMNLFVEATESELIEYIKNPMSNEWMALTIPLTSEMKDMFVNPQASVKLMEESLKEAKILSTEKINEIDHVVMEVTANAEAMTKFYSQLNDPNINSTEVKEMLKSLGDINYKVWIRKDNLYMNKMYMDISPIFKSMIDSLPPNTPSEEVEQLKNMIMTMDATMSDFGKIEEIKIPDEIKQSAIKIPLLDQKTN